MRMVYLISGVHMWWGSSMVLGIPLPRPFGAIEPFFLLPGATTFLVGLTFIVVGLLPLMYFHIPGMICRTCSLIPQQAALSWGFVIGATDVWLTNDTRSWYALAQPGAFFIGHAFEASDLLIAEYVERRKAREDRKEDGHGP